MPQFPAELQLSSLDGTNGFKLSGVAASDYQRLLGRLGGRRQRRRLRRPDRRRALRPIRTAAAPARAMWCSARPRGSPPTSTSRRLDGSNGFKLSGVAADDCSGCSVASAGDVNGDGFADLIVGARDADPHGDDSGASYVVFGKASGFAANLDLSSARRQRTASSSAAWRPIDDSGSSVASAGDVNGDGFADLIVGAPSGRPATAAPTPARAMWCSARPRALPPISTSRALDGTNGFKLSGVAAR